MSSNVLSGAVDCLPNVLFSDPLILLILLLKDPMPSEIGELTNLQHMDLRLNNLSGTLPPSIGHCKKLVTLNLSNNHFTGVAAI
jgi:Leucine-rich repeat (LRR) protein